MENQAAKSQERQNTANMIQKRETISVLRNGSTTPATSVNNSHAIAPQIQPELKKNLWSQLINFPLSVNINFAHSFLLIIINHFLLISRAIQSFETIQFSLDQNYHYQIKLLLVMNSHRLST